jgi:integrase
MKIYNYFSKLASPIQSFIDEKRVLGRKFDKESLIFYEFDRFLVNQNLDKEELPKTIVEAWIEKRPNEKRKNQRYRLNFTKRFVLYLQSRGYTAYYPDLSIATHDDNEFVPYIFSNDELTGILGYFENMKPSRSSTVMHLVLPLLFRTLCCCGLRLSEATHLKIYDVNFDDGILHIRNAKYDKQRYVPMSPDLIVRFREYRTKIHESSDVEDYFFPNARRNNYSNGEIYRRFREALWHSGIEHKGRGFGPRVHDLRHTFAVRCMQKIEKSKGDIMIELC